MKKWLGNVSHIYAIGKRIRDYCHQREGLGLLLVLLISLGIHVAILLVKPLPRIEEWTDSLTYIQSPCNYFRGEFDSFRTPVYPWLIRGVEWIVSDPQALPAPMAGIQIGCFLLSIPVFYAASRRILQNRWILWGVTLGYACSLQLIYWNFIIHTESLSIVLLVLFYYGMVRFLETPNRRWAVTVSLGTLVLCLLRPAFLYIPILLLLFWIFRWVLIPSERRISGSGLLAILLTWSLLGMYAEVNRKHSGLLTLSTVSLVNQFDDVVNAGISNRGTDLTMAARIADLRKEEKAEEHSHSHIFLQLQCRYRYTLPEI